MTVWNWVCVLLTGGTTTTRPDGNLTRVGRSAWLKRDLKWTPHPGQNFFFFFFFILSRVLPLLQNSLIPRSSPEKTKNCTLFELLISCCVFCCESHPDWWGGVETKLNQRNSRLYMTHARHWELVRPTTDKHLHVKVGRKNTNIANTNCECEGFFTT